MTMGIGKTVNESNMSQNQIVEKSNNACNTTHWSEVCTEIAKVNSSGLVKLAPVVAYQFYLSVPAAFTQPEAST